MFPGFVSMYKDSVGKPHVYFFRGIGDNMKPIYRTLDLTHIKEDYRFTELEDGAVDYIFDNLFLSTIDCKLVNISTGETERVKISI